MPDWGRERGPCDLVLRTRRWLVHRPWPPPSGYNVEVTSLATDGRASRDYSRVTLELSRTHLLKHRPPLCSIPLCRLALLGGKEPHQMLETLLERPSTLKRNHICARSPPPFRAQALSGTSGGSDPPLTRTPANVRTPQGTERQRLGPGEESERAPCESSAGRAPPSSGPRKLSRDIAGRACSG